MSQEEILPEKVKTAVRGLNRFERVEIDLPPARKPGADVEVFQGQRVCVIRMDGKVFRSDQTHSTPELRHLFSYIEKNGVTPALMDYLRQFGSKVICKSGDTALESRSQGGTQILERRIEKNAAQLRSKERMNKALAFYRSASPLISLILIGLLALSAYFLSRLYMP